MDQNELEEMINRLGSAQFDEELKQLLVEILRELARRPTSSITAIWPGDHVVGEEEEE